MTPAAPPGVPAESRGGRRNRTSTPVPRVRSLSPGEFEDGDCADPFGLFCVLGEAGVAAGLLGVDAVAFVTGELANGHGVAVGSTLDRALADGREVVVPVGVGRCASLGRE